MLGSSAVAAQLEARGADILPPVSIGHRRPPLPRQRVQQRQRVSARGVDRQVNVFERPFQRELGCEIGSLHLVQLGVGDRRVERTCTTATGRVS